VVRLSSSLHKSSHIVSGAASSSASFSGPTVLYPCALLRFHFAHGNFVRWLGGEYTNRHRDWEATFRTMQDVCTRAPPIDLPPADFPCGFCICTKSVPLKGSFDSPSKDLKARAHYDNHPAVAGNFSNISYSSSSLPSLLHLRPHHQPHSMGHS
jgi:hypothetical protein